MALANAVLFPHSLMPLHIFEPRYRDMLAYTLDGDRMFSVALMKKGIEEAAEIDDLCPVAGVGLIRACVGNENGTSNLVLQGLARVRLVAWRQETPFKIAKVEIPLGLRVVGLHIPDMHLAMQGARARITDADSQG